MVVKFVMRWAVNSRFLCVCGLAWLVLPAVTLGQAQVVPGDAVVLPPGTLAIGVATQLEPDPEPSVIDLGFFYAAELQQRGRSLLSLDQTADEMVAFINQAFVDTGLPASLRIAFRGVFPQSLGGIGTRAAHDQLRDYTTTIRETVLADFGVDIVVLLKATDDADEFFGVATLGTEASLSDPLTVPHAVVCLGAAPTSGLECFGRGGIFAHEVGHLFGAGHQRNAVGGWGGAFPYSQASTCGGGTIVHSPVSVAVGIYSTPGISAGGEPCGVSAEAGADGIDNAFTIDLTRALVAALRPAMPVAGNLLIESPLEYPVSEGSLPITLNLSRDGDVAIPTRVSLAVISAPAHRQDVVITPQEVAFGAGQVAASVEVRIVDDAIFEPTPEVVEIGLRNPLRMSLPAASFKFTITDNDNAPPPPPPPPPQPGGSGGGSLSTWLLLGLLVLMFRKRFVA